MYMGRSPKTGRELHPEIGRKGPRWLADIARRLMRVEPRNRINYTEELRFHSEDGVAEYWHDHDDAEGLELVIDALDALGEEKQDYQPVETWMDEGRLYWAEQVETHAHDLINHYFTENYGYIPGESEASALEQQAAEAYRDSHG